MDMEQVADAETSLSPSMTAFISGYRERKRREALAALNNEEQARVEVERIKGDLKAARVKMRQAIDAANEAIRRTVNVHGEAA